MTVASAALAGAEKKKKKKTKGGKTSVADLTAGMENGLAL